VNRHFKALIAVLLLTASALGQVKTTSSRIGIHQTPRYRHPSRRVREYSWIYIDAPEPREIKVHDIITILVDEKSEVTLKSKFKRQRTASLKAELKEFIRIDSDGNLGNAASNQPTIDAQLNGRLNSDGQHTNQEGIRYRIAATVVDVLPNGNIVLEARKAIRTNQDVWEYSLTGVIRSEEISIGNTAMSENIANLVIDKNQRGKVYDSTKRTWGVFLYDLLSPF
jgi:flagellar L-ring protein FlgH